MSGKQHPQQFAEAHDLLEQAVADGVFPGAAFGVLSHGQVFIDAVGRQTYEDSSPAIEPSTVYDLASLTKVVATTAMAMLLYQRGHLDLNLRVADLLPEFRVGDGGQANRETVTVRHLLAHTSGLAGYARLFENHDSASSLFDACLHMPLEAPPGVRAEYSDIGFILLGRILELLAAPDGSQTLDRFCQREIFAPLDMADTYFRPVPSAKHEIPPTEDDKVFRHRVVQGEVQDENCWVLGGVSGHAGLFGNAGDLLKFSRTLIDTSMQFFEQHAVDLFSERVGKPHESSRALGWDTPSQPSSSGTLFSPHSIGHLGYAGTSLWIDLRDRCSIVLLTNRTWPSRENQGIRQFRPVFHNAVRAAMLSKSAGT